MKSAISSHLPCLGFPCTSVATKNPLIQLLFYQPSEISLWTYDIPLEMVACMNSGLEIHMTENVIQMLWAGLWWDKPSWTVFLYISTLSLNFLPTSAQWRILREREEREERVFGLEGYVYVKRWTHRTIWWTWEKWQLLLTRLRNPELRISQELIPRSGTGSRILVRMGCLIRYLLYLPPRGYWISCSRETKRVMMMMMMWMEIYLWSTPSACRLIGVF